mgnify:CR=1 FL=1
MIIKYKLLNILIPNAYFLYYFFIIVKGNTGF